MHLSPDEISVYGGLNATVVITWAVMAVALPLLVLFRRSMVVEAVVEFSGRQTQSILGRENFALASFVGSLFIFIFVLNWVALVPYVDPPTASVSTCGALAIITLCYGVIMSVRETGWRGYARRFVEPFFFLLPFNILSEAVKGFSLAMRLYGNMMSGAFMVGLMISIAPMLFPALFNLFGLVAGTIQPFIFMVLATVYISMGMAAPDSTLSNPTKKTGGKNARS